MSHVVTLDLSITSLDVLEEACTLLGLEFLRDQKSYRWFGRSVGDYKIPNGFSEKDLGKCLHAISIPKDNESYQMGVVQRRDGQPGFTLIYDFWGPGQAMKQKVGADGGLLKQAYAISRAKKEALRKGMRTLMKKKQNGNLLLEVY